MAKPCGSCGLVVGDEARFCQKCGYHFAGDPQANAPAPNNWRQRTPTGRFVIAILVILGVVAIGTLSRDAGPSPSGSVNDSRTHAEPSASKSNGTTIGDLSLAFTWRKDGFDSIMMATFTIENKGTQAVKDLEITCTHRANSGTVIDHNTRTIYEKVNAGSKKTIANFNMGFIDSQATKSGCSITDFKIAE